jgi:hypothetical protein
MQDDSSNFKHAITNPSRGVLCIMLAGRNHMSGVFLASIIHWAKYGKAVIAGAPGYWVANRRKWWMKECCLTASQYDRTICKLEKLGLIERRQWWYGGKNILFLRPTEKTRSYIASAATWIAAEQFLGYPSTGSALEFGGYEKPSLTEVASSNENVKNHEPGLADEQISKHISNFLNNQTSKPTSAAAASPPCADENLKAQSKKISGKDTITEGANNKIVLQKAALAWTSWLAGKYPDEVQSGKIVIELKPKELGKLAIVAEIFVHFSKEINYTDELGNWFVIFLIFRN